MNAISIRASDIAWTAAARTITSSPWLVDSLIRQAQKTPYEHIQSIDGTDIYMGRWWLANPYSRDASGKRLPARYASVPSVRIHHIRRPDMDRHMHSHPWDARTIILRNWYEEERHLVATDPWPLELRRVLQPSGRIELRNVYRREAGYTGRLLFDQYHRISAVPPEGVWTLFLTWPDQGDWGFDVDGDAVPHETYFRNIESFNSESTHV